MRRIGVAQLSVQSLKTRVFPVDVGCNLMRFEELLYFWELTDLSGGMGCIELALAV